MFLASVIKYFCIIVSWVGVICLLKCCFPCRNSIWLDHVVDCGLSLSLRRVLITAELLANGSSFSPKRCSIRTTDCLNIQLCKLQLMYILRNPLSSSGLHQSYDVCIEERLSYLFFAVLCTTVVHSDMHTHQQPVLTVECWFTSSYRPRSRGDNTFGIVGVCPSVCPCMCPSVAVGALLFERLTFDLDFWHEGRPWPWLAWYCRSRS